MTTRRLLWTLALTSIAVQVALVAWQVARRRRAAADASAGVPRRHSHGPGQGHRHH